MERTTKVLEHDLNEDNYAVNQISLGRAFAAYTLYVSSQNFCLNISQDRCQYVWWLKATGLNEDATTWVLELPSRRAGGVSNSRLPIFVPQSGTFK